jgi:predicted DNA-binding transcriptional regulator AlpA
MHPAPRPSEPAESQSDPAQSGLLRAAEVAERLGLGIRTVWKLRATGMLPSVRILGATLLGATLFRAEDVARLLQEGVR